MNNNIFVIVITAPEESVFKKIVLMPLPHDRKVFIEYISKESGEYHHEKRKWERGELELAAEILLLEPGAFISQIIFDNNTILKGKMQNETIQ